MIDRASTGSKGQSRGLGRWALAIAWAGWGAVPALASARPVEDLLAIYAWCAGAAGAAVALLWLAALGARAWGRTRQ